MRTLCRLLVALCCISTGLWAQGQTPTAVGMTPASGTGSTQTFSFTFSDGDGVADLNVLNILVNSALDARKACYLAYVPASPTSGTLLLVNDAGDVGGALASLPIPSTGSISNGQCTINGTGSTTTGSGSSLTMNLNITFSAAFGGNPVFYMAARDKVSNNSGWRTKGTWNVPPIPAMDPIVVSMTPGRGEVSRQTYQFGFQDPTGAANLGVVNVLVNDALDATRACYIAYSNTFSLLFLVKDVGGPSQTEGPGTLGAAGTLENSQCAINLATSSFTRTGNNATLTLDMTFKDAFAGDRVFYVAARSANELRNSGWKAKGSLGYSALGGVSNNLISFTPSTATPGQTFNATVTAQATNFVAGQVQASLGVGVTVNSVTVTSPTVLTLGVTVTAGAAGGPRTLTVVQGANNYQLQSALTVQSSTSGPPLISTFTPASASPGTLVTVTGNNLGLGPQVTLTAQGTGTLDVPVTSFDVSSLSFVVPPGTATGPIRISVTGNSTVATSASNLTIVPSNSFTLSANPATLTLVRGQSAAYAVTVNSSNGFSQLADLSVSGLPAGVTFTLTRRLLSAGQTAILTLTAPANQPLASTPLTISATAAIDGLPVLSSAPVTVQVQAPTTSFIGRTVVSDDAQTPIAGVTATLLGSNGNGGTTSCSGSAKSDAAGNLIIANLPVGCAGSQLIGFDGLTATSPAGKYAGVNIVYTFTAGQVTASPVLVHLPRIDDKETFMVTQNAATDQSYSYKTIPGLSLTVYARTTLTMPDGTRPDPFPLVAVQVPVDRLPDAKPSVPTMVSAFIVAFQPANAKASQPVAVFYPNTIFTAPGTSMTMMTLDPTRGRMVPYGTGRVSANGLTIVPDLDPAYPGKRYGIVNFDWHGPMPPPPNNNNPGPGGGGNGNTTGGPCSGGGGDPCGGNPGAGDPVDILSGLQIVKATDIAISGPRGRIGIDRVYRSGTANASSFGVGMQFEYDWSLSAGGLSGAQAVNLISPDGNQFLMSRQPDGTFTNASLPFLRGAVLSAGSGNNASLRWKNGTVYAFAAPAIGLPRLVSITDRNNNKTTLSRPDTSPAQVTSITDPVGRSLALTWDASNRVIRVQDPIGREVRYTYNATGSLETVTDPAGGVTRYEYNTDRNMVRMFDQRGVKVFENIYDGSKVIQQTVADGGVYRFSYGFIIVLAGGGGSLTMSPRPGEIVNQCVGFCASTLVTDPLGRQTTYRFYPQGYLASVTDALGRKKTFDRHPETNVLLNMTGDGQCPVCGPPGAGDQYFTYDSNGNVLTKEDALGNRTTYEYEPIFNRPTRGRNALGHETISTYDSNGLILNTRDAKGNVTSYKYDAFGLLIEVSDASLQKTIFTYGSTGDLVRVTDALGNPRTFRYDPISREIESTDTLGRKTSQVYDTLDRIISKRDARRQVSQFRYDAVGNLLEVKDPKGNSTLFAYDVMNRQISKTSALGKSSNWARDLMGNITRYVDRRGQSTDIVYDALDQAIRESYQDGARVERLYDPRGRLIEVRDSAVGIFKFTYDVVGSLVLSSGPVGTVEYRRDALRRVRSRLVAGQPTVTYTYDSVGNLTRADSTPASATFVYDSRNLISGQTSSNGVSSSYIRDPLGRVELVSHQKGAAALYSQVLKYDQGGNPLGSDSNAPQPLATPEAGATFDSENRLLTRSGVTYTYDEEGNRTSEAGPGGVVSYSWDTRGRLLSITSNSGGTTAMKYDFNGLMVERRATGGGASTTERYLLDDLANIAWMSQNEQSNSVLSGRSVDSHLAISGPATAVRFGSINVINSTVLTTDSMGRAVGQMGYEPFGKLNESGVEYPFLFTGRTATTKSLSYHRLRHLDVVAGTFISQDPIGLAGGDVNLYRYAGNSPGRLADPSGLDVDACVVLTLACMAGTIVVPVVEPVCWWLGAACLVKEMLPKDDQPQDICEAPKRRRPRLRPTLPRVEPAPMPTWPPTTPDPTFPPLVCGQGIDCSPHYSPEDKLVNWKEQSERNRRK